MVSKLRSDGALKVAAAGTLATLGLGFAVWALWPHLAPSERGPRPAEAPRTEAQRTLTDGLLDTPVGDRPGPAVEAATARLTPLLDGVQGIPAPQDVVDAFAERLRATFDGQYQRDLRAKIARGMEAPPQPWPESGGEFWQASRERLRGSDIGVESMEVRWILRGGNRVAPMAVDEGYGITKTTTTEFESVIDAIGPRLDVVEVRLPMRIKPLEVPLPMGIQPAQGASSGPVLVGYQFAWSPERGQWVPYQNCMYTPDEAPYGSLPF